MSITLKFSGVHRYEPDNWSGDGEIFTSRSKMDRLQAYLEQGKVLVAEHWHYRGARAPNRLLIEEVDDFIEYLEKEAIAGDIIEVFDLSEVWRNKGDAVLSGKCPDENGEVPEKGAY